jgi:tetratricopeptide (TPR) repeat protein
MRAAAEQFPNDPHVLTLYAESLMDLYPWAYWNEDGSPKEHTEALVDAIERAMEIDPEHPGALHLYIHAMEQHTPEKAVVAADTLGPLVPVAGHLVHMPSHIYLRVGRYHDAVLANTEASLADENYLSQCNAQGFYPAAYYPHNIHFLWYSAMMEGHKGLAVSSAQRLHEKIDLDMARQFGAIQRYLAVRVATYVRFGMWDEALAEPPAPEGMPMTTFTRSYAQGVALAATGQVDAAREKLASMQAQRESGELVAVMDRQGDIAELLTEIGLQLVEAEIARAEGNDEAEIDHLQAAVAAQDALPYTEPPFWHFPIRQALGSAYLRMDKPALAQTAFEEDLVNFPNNGWSLYGLKEAMAAQGQPSLDLEQAVAAAWQYADIEPTSGP